MTKVFLLNNHDSFTYNLAALINRYKDVTLIIKTPEETNIDEIALFDRVVLSPGPGLPSEYKLMSDIIDRYKSTKIILGVCLGHQAIAEYFGANLSNFEQVKHGWINKLKVVEPSCSFLSKVPTISDVGVYHSWYVSQANFPECLTITGLCEDNIIMAMEHKNYSIQSVQFHPESFITTYGVQMIENWLGK